MVTIVNAIILLVWGAMFIIPLLGFPMGFLSEILRKSKIDKKRKALFKALLIFFTPIYYYLLIMGLVILIDKYF